MDGTRAPVQLSQDALTDDATISRGNHEIPNSSNGETAKYVLFTVAPQFPGASPANEDVVTVMPQDPGAAPRNQTRSVFINPGYPLLLNVSGFTLLSVDKPAVVGQESRFSIAPLENQR